MKIFDYEDQKVFDLLSNGKTVGLFQVESAGMRDALVQMKPNHIEDIIALVALYRPGPMSNIPIYNDCKHGKQTPDYLHPSIRRYFKTHLWSNNLSRASYAKLPKNYQVLLLVRRIFLRRAMGKKKRAELEKQKQRFYCRCSKKWH